MRARSSTWHRAERRSKHVHNATSRSSVRSRASTGAGRSSMTSKMMSSTSPTSSRPARRSVCRHSRRAVVASQPAKRSGSSIRPKCSTNRIHVVCTTSVASAVPSRCARATDHRSLVYRSTIAFHAAWSPASARRNSSVTDTFPPLTSLLERVAALQASMVGPTDDALTGAGDTASSGGRGRRHPVHAAPNALNAHQLTKDAASCGSTVARAMQRVGERVASLHAGVQRAHEWHDVPVRHDRRAAG